MEKKLLETDAVCHIRKNTPECLQNSHFVYILCAKNSRQWLVSYQLSAERFILSDIRHFS